MPDPSFPRPGRPEPSSPGRDEPSPPGAGRSVGPYRLVRFLAAGGMGQVWEAEEPELGRRVALKLLAPERSAVLDRARFEREARAGARLRHPGLVTTYAHGEDDGQAWIAQELVEGAWTLEAFLAERRRADRVPRGYYADVARLVAQVADGLHAAHEAGIVHRDVKPANVLLDEGGRPRVTDFGLAHVAGEAALSRTGDVAGTWAYMSPEQVRASRERVDRRSDVFSLGVVLYELLTLRRPFDGDSVQLTADRILREDPRDPRQVRSGCPGDLATICLKALEKAPSARYATAGAFADDLRRFLADESIVARRPGTLGRALRWSRRHRTASVGGVAGGAALVVVSGLLVGAIRDARALERLGHLTAEQAELARAGRDATLRLAAAATVDQLVERQESLWPPDPARIPDFEHWLADADAVVAELDSHRRTLAGVRAGGALPSGGATDDGTTRAWWDERLSELVADLEVLRDGPLAEGYASTAMGWSVPDRLAFARGLEAGLAGDDGEAWERARPAIRATYGFELEPVPGLVPLGPDPDSGLHEFAHLATGAVAQRDAEGRLQIGAETGVVLVLLPGGPSWIGVQSTDPEGPNHDPAPDPVLNGRPLERVELAPAWISKYELTQAQWRRLTGEEPGRHGGRARDLRPIESITFDDAVLVLGRVGLDIPDGALWEHACRAGSDGVFGLGDDALERGWINVIDRDARATGDEWASSGPEPTFSDGSVPPGPVGTWPPNAWGLHEVHGNVGELTRESGTGAGEEVAVSRGGSFADPARAARAHARLAWGPGASGWKTGVRPSKALPPGPSAD